MSSGSSDLRDQLIELTIHTYFDAVDERRMDDALDLFHDDATFTLYPSGTVHRGRKEIAGMYEGIFARHGHPERKTIDICCDPVAGLVTASFQAEFVREDGTSLFLNNVNIWRVEDMKFRWIKVYTSNPAF